MKRMKRMKRTLEGMRGMFETGMTVLIALVAMIAVETQFTGVAFADYDEGELIIKFDGQAASEIETMKTELDVDEVQVLHTYVQMSGGYRTTWSIQYWQYRSALSLSQIIAAYATRQFISYIEPNYRIYPWGVPDDSQFAEQWGLHNTAQTGGKADADIDAPEAWDYADGKPAQDVTVAVIDTGVDTDHPDLQANIHSFGYDYQNDDADPDDDNGHGTHVAGTIAAVRNNTTGVAGVCASAKIMPLKFLDANGNGKLVNAIKALNDARDMGAKIINASWTIKGYESQALCQRTFGKEVKISTLGSSLLIPVGTQARPLQPQP